MKSINAEEFKNRRLAEPVDDKKLIKMLQSNSLTVEEIAETFNVPFATVSEKINLLKSNKALFRKEDEKFSINETPIEGGRKVLNPDLWRGDVIKFGFTADNHLCSYFERLDVLNLIYDICEGENIPVVLNGGNWIDGEARFNRNEIHKVGLDRQINYAVDVYPYRKGIETWFVSGDDHEGWFSQREGINIGDYWQMKREQAGMFDLKHLGYVEADIDLNEGKFENGSWLRVMHAGGGSCFDYNAKILTKEKGFIPFSELTLDDEVATMSKDTNVFEWQKPTHITNEYYEGDMYSFKARCYDFNVTPNHGLWAKLSLEGKRKKELIKPNKSHGKINCEYNRYNAEEIYNTFYRQKYRMTTVCKNWEGVLIDKIEVPRLEPKNINNKRNAEQMQHIGSVNIKDMAELIAWYVTEGSVYKDRNIIICQCQKINPENHKRICDLLSRIGVRYSLYGRNNKDISISSLELGTYLKKESGHLSRYKHLPIWLKNQPKEILQIVFDTMVEGDGWLKNAAGFGYKSISKRLREDFMEIAQKLGYGVSVGKDTVSVRVCQNEPYITNKPVKYQYKGKIYCCSVPNELIYIESNGKLFWSHNSYATSYSAQKIVESLQGGEKPSVLMIGHYHKLLYAYIRNVHTVQCGTTQDQSIFMRKKKIEAHVGGGIIELYRDKYGSINRVRVDFITAFDKKFYVGKDKYWKS